MLFDPFRDVGRESRAVDGQRAAGWNLGRARTLDQHGAHVFQLREQYARGSIRELRAQ